MYVSNIELPGTPIINMVMALYNFAAILSWTSPPYNCSLINYSLEIVEEENISVVILNDSITLVTTLMVGKNYTFRVASVYAAGSNMSNWSQPVSLAMQG